MFRDYGINASAREAELWSSPFLRCSNSIFWRNYGLIMKSQRKVKLWRKLWKSVLSNRAPAKSHTSAFPHRHRLSLRPESAATVTAQATVTGDYIYIYIYIYIHTHIYIYIYIYISLSIYIYIYMSISISLRESMVGVNMVPA